MSLTGKRILLTTSHRNIGSGGSFQLGLLAQALVEAGARVETVFKGDPDTTADHPGFAGLRNLGVPIHFIRTNRWYSPRQILLFRRLLREGRFDLVHTHKGGDLSLALLALPRMPPCGLINTRGVNFRLGFNRYKYRSRRLHRIIVVSENSKRVMVECGVPADKIRVVYGGMDPQRFHPRPEERAPLRDELGLPQNALVCVVAANLVRQKGHEDYLRAAAALRAEWPELWHVFAGAGEQTQLREAARQLNVADRLIFAGFRRDMERVYAAADLSVMPGFAGEGVSGVLREALACGVPVITTDVGGNIELITHEQTGLVVPVRQPAALAEAIKRLVQNPSFTHELAERGRHMVLEHFSTEARARNIFGIYEEVLGENNRNYGR